MIPYDALLTVHLLAVATFLACLLLVAICLPFLTRRTAEDRDGGEIARLRVIDLYVGTPALLLVWACGIGMAVEAGWYVTGWLQAKALLVGLLSVMHIHHARLLGRLSKGRPVSPERHRFGIILVILVGIGILVIAKPF